MNIICSQIGGENLTISLIKKLKKELNWNPVFINAISQESKIKLEKVFPDCGFVVSSELRQGIIKYSDIIIKKSIDKNIIEQLSKFQSNVLSRFEDTSGYNASFDDRLNFYYDILNFWNSVIINKKPEVFFSYTLPHLQSDYPLYLLCKYVYSIPVIFFDGYPHFKNRFCISNSLENLEEPFLREYKNLKNNNISEKVKTFIFEIKKTEYEKKPEHIKNYFDYLNSKSGTMKDILRIIKLTLKGKLFTNSNVTMKKNKIPWGSKKSLMNNFEYIIFKRKLAKNSVLLEKFYSDIAIKEIDKSHKYFYFAAPYQPEASTTISLGAYENLLQVMNIINEELPENWKIYYKEHPSIFERTQKGSLSRSFEYYRKLKRLKNVIVVSHNINTYDLIRNSKAVIGVSGTTLWYSFAKMKPTIIFGNHWLSGSKSVFTVSSGDELNKVFKKIIDGYKVDEEDILLYAQAIYNSTIKNIKVAGGRTETAYGENYLSNSLDDPELVKMFDAVHKNYKIKYQKKL